MACNYAMRKTSAFSISLLISVSSLEVAALYHLQFSCLPAFMLVSEWNPYMFINVLAYNCTIELLAYNCAIELINTSAGTCFSTLDR